jgi:hypothetical protein
MSMKTFGWGLVAAAVVATAAPADARNYDRWEHLGSKTVKLTSDFDIIRVGAREGDFRKLQIVVRENGVFFNSMVVEYSNGGDDNIPLRFHIPPGGRSRLIDLRGGDRYIRNIKFSYRAVRNGRGRARVEVFGRR